MTPNGEALRQAIAAKKRRLDALRPLALDGLAGLDAWYDVELTYASNAIEGNTLSRSETAIVLEQGLTVRGKPLKDHLEAIDHRDALAFVRRLRTTTEPIRESDIRDIHRLVLGRSAPGEAGRYSTVERHVLGSVVRFPSPAEIPALMGDFGRWLAASDATPETAFEAHARLVTIHPFADGNGRTARLLMNLVLFRAGFPPLVVRPEDRPDYIDSLERRQLTGDGTALEALLFERLDDSLDRYLEAIDRGGTARAAEP